MKHFFLLLLSLAPLFLFAQKNETTRKIDELVTKTANSISTTSSQTVISGKSYTYIVSHGKISFVQVKYKADSIDYEEQYYLDKENLVYAKEKENKKGITREGHFYFTNYKLIFKETFGHEKTEPKDSDPEKEILKKFDLRMNELKSKINK